MTGAAVERDHLGGDGRPKRRVVSVGELLYAKTFWGHTSCKHFNVINSPDQLDCGAATAQHRLSLIAASTVWS